MLTARVNIPEAIRSAIDAHAENCSPDECCGLIASDANGRVRFAYPTTNRDPSPHTYTIDPDEHFGAMLHAERMGWELSGVFHSHPDGPAMPSETDVEKALEPEWLYLIATGTALRGFSIRDSQVAEVELS